MDIRELVKPKINPNIPQISPGDTVKLSLKTIEGDKERLQHFQGMVIRIRKGVSGGSFTVRRVSYGVGVERTFPFQSPMLQGVEVLRHGKVRRAKLYYMRRLSAKQSRLKERRERAAEQIRSQEEERLIEGEPVQDEPVEGKLVQEEPIAEELVAGEPVQEKPVEEEPV
jgi:large subunit ribosomal protein L19